MKKILVAILGASLLFSSIPAAVAAETVTTESSTAAIEYVRARGIITDTDGTFHPEAPLTRADFITGVTKHFYPFDDRSQCYRNIAPKLPPNFTKLFSDAPTSAWYAEEVCIAMLSGLVKGNRDGTLRPMKGLTYAEGATITAQVYGLTYPTLQVSRLKWYETPMWVLRNHGALPTRVDPAALMTRGDAAWMLYALRNQQRFPAESTIWRVPDSWNEGSEDIMIPDWNEGTDDMPADWNEGAEEPEWDGGTHFEFDQFGEPTGNWPNQVQWQDTTTSPEEAAALAASHDNTDISAETVMNAMTRTAPRISRRQLLLQVEQAATQSMIR